MDGYLDINTIFKNKELAEVQLEYLLTNSTLPWELEEHYTEDE
jgi:hypothetical protein